MSEIDTMDRKRQGYAAGKPAPNPPSLEIIKSATTVGIAAVKDIR